MSQALERIRQAARQRKKEKFTALLHHISIDLLDEAFFELRKDAAPGVDGLIWTDYEQNHTVAHREWPASQQNRPLIVGRGTCRPTIEPR